MLVCLSRVFQQELLVSPPALCHFTLANRRLLDSHHAPHDALDAVDVKFARLDALLRP